MSPEAERDLKKLLRIVEETRSSWKITVLLEGIALVTAFLFAGVVVVFGFDNLFGNAIRRYGVAGGMRWLDPLVRILFLLVLGGGLAYAMIRYLIGPAMRKFSVDRTALAIEKAFPDIDNRLVNAIQLSRDESLDGFSRAVADVIVIEAADNVAGKSVTEKAVPKKRLKKFALAAGAALLAVVLYAGLGWSHFANALKRFAMPGSDVATLSATRLKVFPGNQEVLAGESLVISARVSGTIPDFAEIEIAEKGRKARKDRMDFDGGSFAYTVRHVDADFTYRVRGGDAVTPVYRIRVKTVPVVERMEAEISYPDYTAREIETLKEVPGNLNVLPGTVITFFAHTNKKIASSPPPRLKMDGGESVTADIRNENTLVAMVRVRKSTAYWFYMYDVDGYEPVEPPKYTLTVVEDEAPTVLVTSPKAYEERTPLGKLSINLRLRDDFALRRARIDVRHATDPKKQFVLKSWDITPGERSRFPAHIWRLQEYEVKPGDIFEYRVAVSDNKNEEVLSPKMRVEIISSEKREDKSIDAIRSLYNDLTKLLSSQQRLYRANQRFSSELSRREMPSGTVARRQNALIEGQKDIRKEGDRIAGTIAGDSRTEKIVKTKLPGLVANEMLDAIKAMEPVVAAAKRPEKVSLLREVAGAQTEIITGIRKLLEELRKGYQNLQDEEAKKTEFAELDPRDLDKAKKLERAKRTLEKFIAEQKEVIEATEELAQKDVEDFTDEDRRKLEDLIQKERELAKTMIDLKDDLSRIPIADSSDGTQVEEHMEIYVDVKLMNAAEAMELENIEIAVTNEEAGLEEAEELQKNIERWLSDHRDNIKWTMEDPPDEIEPPLAELPEELEDLIGELIEDEEELSEEVEDETSMWADSLDKGAGWGTSDGPISNYSAKGVTGNQLPNDNEVGGRSGEGRSGRSHGQMVENETTGKGGRTTPTRITPDPYETGKVDDKSKEEASGATGGGKEGGVGGEGLHGQAPPEMKEAMKRLAAKQAEIRQKAVAAKHKASRKSYPTGSLDEMVVIMKKMEDDLESGRVRDWQARQKVLVRGLEDTREAIRAQLEADREALAKVPSDVKKKFMNASQEDARPEAWRKLIEEYYRSLNLGNGK
ncbi:MAG: hypothetical protein ACYS8W_06700 [Planctomycetota bacterium]|jgi:hypothetical protein